MYRIKWRNRNSSMKMIEGISHYASLEIARQQVGKFQHHFMENTYYIVPV